MNKLVPIIYMIGVLLLVLPSFIKSNQNLKTLSCAVGSAITISSDPVKEYEECGIKIQKLLDGITG